MAMQSTIRAIIIAPTIMLFFTLCLRLVLLFLLFALIVEIVIKTSYIGDQQNKNVYSYCSHIIYVSYEVSISFIFAITSSNITI